MFRFQAVVILLVALSTAFNVHGLLLLRQKFDPSWFIPQNTYLADFISQSRELYPSMGSEVFILMGRLNYTEDMDKIVHLDLEIRSDNQTDIIHHVEGWPKPFSDFVKTFHEKGNNYKLIQL